MRKKIGGLTIGKFLSDVAGDLPAPGGGAVAAVAGAMAASLVEMVCNLTIGKKGYEGSEEEAEEIRRISAEDGRKLLALADRDVEAFNAVMDAYKTEKKDSERGRKIQDALKKASEIPLETARLSKKVASMAERMIERGNKNTLSDARTAKYLADAGVKSALENVEVNMRLIKDDEWKRGILPLIDELK